MKKIHFNNPALPEILNKNGINLICNDNMDITISDEDAERVADIIKEFAPYGILDYFIEHNINSLNEFADLINAADEWKLEFNDIIEQNGWVDETGKERGICSDGVARLYFNDDCKAVIVSI